MPYSTKKIMVELLTFDICQQGSQRKWSRLGITPVRKTAVVMPPALAWRAPSARCTAPFTRRKAWLEWHGRRGVRTRGVMTEPSTVCRAPNWRFFASSTLRMAWSAWYTRGTVVLVRRMVQYGRNVSRVGSHQDGDISWVFVRSPHLLSFSLFLNVVHYVVLRSIVFTASRVFTLSH